MITSEQVKQVAKLSRLKLSDEEINHYTRQLGALLEYFKQLEAAPVDVVATDETMTEMHDTLRDDLPGPRYDHTTIMYNGPDIKLDHFAIPKIIS